MADFEAGNAELVSKELADVFKDPKVTTEEFLYDYRNAVGVMLCLYLDLKTKSGLSPSDNIGKVLGVVKSWRWHEGTGEVIFAYSLLLQAISHSDNELGEIARMCQSDMIEALSDYSKLVDRSKDFSWKLLTVTYLDVKVKAQIFDLLKDRIGTMRQLAESAQIEVLASLLWALTKFNSSDFSELAEQISKILLLQIREVKVLSVDPDFVQRFVSAIRLAKEGLVGQAKQVLKLVEDYSDDRLTVDLATVNVGMPSLSILAKAKIALVGAGYYRPFMLSTKQRDIYEAIHTAEKNGLRYIRRQELAAGLVAGCIALLIGVQVLVNALTIGLFANLGVSILILTAYGDIAWAIWTEGAITKKSILNAIHRIADAVGR